MPRKPRIELAGKYHIINRGVAQKAYKQGYSQHMIAKVLGLNQATVQRIIKRTKALASPDPYISSVNINKIPICKEEDCNATK